MAGIKISDLPSIVSPAASDVFAVSQSGSTYKESITQLGSLVLLLGGGTMTGDLILNADPSTNLQAATKQYVDGMGGAFLPLAGGTMTGDLILNADPTVNFQAATKQYVDTAGGSFLPLAGGTMTGSLVLNADPTTNLEAATKQYVDTAGGAFLPLAGGTMTGSLILNADPITNLEAATKQYVDTAGGAFLPLAGGTMTGTLTLDADPVNPLEASTKQYSDSVVTGYLPLSGGTMTGNLILNADPSTALQAATKSYVDMVAIGLNVQPACRVATTANLTATYSNGASGVGATLTNSGAMAAISIDGVSLSLNDRVLVKNQSTTFQNGIYTVTTVGSGAANWVLTRATDYDTTSEIQPGDFVLIVAGTVNTQTSWVQTATVTAIGTDAISFSQFTANPSTFLKVANNLSDVANQVTSYSNILPTTVTTAATANLTNNSKHIPNRVSAVAYTLPTTAAVGTEINIVGLGSGGWSVGQNASQVIHVGTSNTTTGTGGSIASSARYDCVKLVCVVADTEWTVQSMQSSGLFVV